MFWAQTSELRVPAPCLRFEREEKLPSPDGTFVAVLAQAAL